MASNDEAQGSGDCDDVYMAEGKYLNLVDEQRLMLLGPPFTSETDIETGTETSVETQTKEICPRGNNKVIIYFLIS